MLQIQNFQQAPSIISSTEFKQLLAHTSIIEEHDTLISGMIRIFNIDKAVLIQETSNKNEIIIRKLPNLAAARHFVEDRMTVYNRMWDGCGCKIDYYS